MRPVAIVVLLVSAALAQVALAGGPGCPISPNDDGSGRDSEPGSPVEFVFGAIVSGCMGGSDTEDNYHSFGNQVDYVRMELSDTHCTGTLAAQFTGPGFAKSFSVGPCQTGVRTMQGPFTAGGYDVKVTRAFGGAGPYTLAIEEDPDLAITLIQVTKEPRDWDRVRVEVTNVGKGTVRADDAPDVHIWLVPEGGPMICETQLGPMDASVVCDPVYGVLLAETASICGIQWPAFLDVVCHPRGIQYTDLGTYGLYDFHPERMRSVLAFWDRNLNIGDQRVHAELVWPTAEGDGFPYNDASSRRSATSPTATPGVV